MVAPGVAAAGGASGADLSAAFGPVIVTFLAWLVLAMAGFAFALLSLKGTRHHAWGALNLVTLCLQGLLAALLGVLGVLLDPKFFNLLVPLVFVVPQVVLTAMGRERARAAQGHRPQRSSS